MLDSSMGIIDFLDSSPTPYHASQTMIEELLAQGFVLLDEKHPWDLVAGGKYVVCRDSASVIAFIVGQQPAEQAGFRLIGAHTDSPCLRLKSQPVKFSQKCATTQLKIETYGGVLTHTWFDRDLSLAGKVSYVDANDQRHVVLINLNDAIGMIPSLAIHLNREANSNSSVNAEEHLPVVIGGQLFKNDAEFKQWLLQHVQAQDEQAADVLSFDLRFYATQGAAVIGEDKSILASARLDNLLSCYVGLQALLQAGDQHHAVLVCTDHEEVGSVSYSGAQGPFLEQVLTRICGSQQLPQALANSLLVSVDNAHAIHPNYPNKHDGNHAPTLNGGPVIKINANKRYATDAESTAVIHWLAQKAAVPVQEFIMRADMACGSTIGPITSGNLGVRAVDIGVAQWGMHSIRETIGVDDIDHMEKLLATFLQVDGL